MYTHVAVHGLNVVYRNTLSLSVCTRVCGLRPAAVHARVHALAVWQCVYLIPGSVGEHASKEGVHVTSIHGLAVFLDALCISEDQALPQQGITLPELICDLPAGEGTQLRTDLISDCTDHQVARVGVHDVTQGCRAKLSIISL